MSEPVDNGCMDISPKNRIPLRGGAITTDPRLDRIVQFDERSRDFPITSIIDETKPRTRWWRHTAKLDQGKEGACVGFAWAHELNASPIEVSGMDDAFAQRLYKRAQQIDEWPGEDYSGTSVLAGAKAVGELGYLDEYRWAFGIDDVLLTLSHFGPVILGVNWYSGMYTPDGNQYIRPSGYLAGGHAIMAIAYSHEAQEIWLLNSWGRDWGWDGLCRMRVSDVVRLLNEKGEACVPVVRGEGIPPAPEPTPPEPEPTPVVHHSMGAVVNVATDTPTQADDPEPGPEPEPPKKKAKAKKRRSKKKS